MSDEAKLAKHERVAKVMDFFMTCDLTDVNPDRLVAMGCQFLRTMPEQITEMESSVALSRLLITLLEMVAQDRLEAVFNYVPRPEPTEQLPFSARRRRGSEEVPPLRQRI